MLITVYSGTGQDLTGQEEEEEDRFVQQQQRVATSALALVKLRRHVCNGMSPMSASSCYTYSPF